MYAAQVMDTHAWAGPSGKAEARLGLAYVSSSRLLKREELKKTSRGRRLTEQLWQRVYKPVFEAANEDKWETLQDALGAMGEMFANLPEPDTSRRSSGEQDRIKLASRIAREFPDLQGCVYEGMRYATRRERILRRRANELESLLAKPDALRSNTAALGFSWSLVCLAIAPVVEDIKRSLEDDAVFGFVSYVLNVGGEDQYLLLRAAEADLLHDREVGSAVDAGTMDEESRRMEVETQSAWLDLQRLVTDTRD